jgi:Ca-activated chloride channel family protein
MRKSLSAPLYPVTLALFLFSLVVAQTPPPQSSQQQQPARPATSIGRATQNPAPQKPVAKPSPTPAPDDDLDVVRVTSNLVSVPVSVTDAAGQPVLGLKVEDFRLEEEGRPQELAQIGDPDQVPLDLAILLDVSGSVDARFAFEQQAAARFIKEVMKPVDRATIFAVDRTPRLEQARDTAERAAAQLMRISPAKGPTAFYDTVVEAARYLAQFSPPQHRRVLVVISDGEDNYSEKIKSALGTTREEQNSVSTEVKHRINDKALLEVGREVQRADAVFYSINPSGEALRLNVISKRAQDGMEQLANTTGGTSFVPEKLENLDAVFRQITSELRSQYLLQYYASDEAPSGKFLHIRVSLPAHSALRVRARQGYYAKKK